MRENRAAPFQIFRAITPIRYICIKIINGPHVVTGKALRAAKRRVANSTYHNLLNLIEIYDDSSECAMYNLF